MRFMKYIYCGGEHLETPPVKNSSISAAAEQNFIKWAIRGLSESCLAGEEAFLEMPATPNSRLFIKSFLEVRQGSRALCWYLGIEIEKKSMKIPCHISTLWKGFGILH